MRRAKKIKETKKRLLDAFLAGTIPEDDYKEASADMAADLEEAKAIEEGSQFSGIKLEEVLAYGCEVLGHPEKAWKAGTLKEKRELVRLYFPQNPTWDGKVFRATVVSKAVSRREDC